MSSKAFVHLHLHVPRPPGLASAVPRCHLVQERPSAPLLSLALRPLSFLPPPGSPPRFAGPAAGAPLSFSLLGVEVERFLLELFFFLKTLTGTRPREAAFAVSGAGTVRPVSAHLNAPPRLRPISVGPLGAEEFVHFHVFVNFPNFLLFTCLF